MSLIEVAVALALPFEELPGSQESVLPFPPYVFAAIATAIFVFLGFVAWSFRDVANRHSQKTGGRGAHGGTGHGSAGHH